MIKTKQHKEILRSSVTANSTPTRHIKITQEINQWISSILSRKSLDDAFESALDELVDRPQAFALGDLYLEDITPALYLLGIWLMNGIDQAKTHLSTETSETKRFESSIDLCKQGFYQAKIATALFVTTKAPVDLHPAKSIGALYALYALADEFYEVERELINKILSDDDIKNCPHIPEDSHEEILGLLLSNAFDNIAIEDKQFLLNGIDHISECLSDSLFLLASISNQIINLK